MPVKSPSFLWRLVRPLRHRPLLLLHVDCARETQTCAAGRRRTCITQGAPSAYACGGSNHALASTFRRRRARGAVGNLHGASHARGAVWREFDVARGQRVVRHASVSAGWCTTWAECCSSRGSRSGEERANQHTRRARRPVLLSRSSDSSDSSDSQGSAPHAITAQPIQLPPLVPAHAGAEQ